MRNVLIISGQEHLHNIRDTIDMELIRCGDSDIQVINNGGIQTVQVNGQEVKVIKVSRDSIEEIDFEELRKIHDLSPLLLVEEIPNPNRLEIIAPDPICCRDHIYKEEREFKKQKKEKFKSPMWNF